MQKRSIYHSMRRMLLYYSTIILAVVFVLVAVLVVRQSYRQYEAYATAKVSDLAEAINRDFYLMINKSSNIVNNTDIISGLQQDYSDDIQAVMGFYDVLDQYYTALEDISLNINPDIIIYPENTTLPDGEHVVRLENCKNPDIINAMRQGDNLFVWGEYTDRSGEIPKSYITLYRNIYSFNRYLGCLEMRTPVSELEKYLLNVALDEDENIHIVSREEAAGRTEDRKLITYTEELLNGYTVVFSRNQISFYFDYAGLLFLYLFIFALAWALVNITSRMAVDSVTQEIYEFLDSIYANQTGTVTKNTQEVILIKEKFLELIEKERLASENLLRREQEKRALEIEMLQNRINPHLLYNSLSAIKWQLLRKRDFEFASMMDALSNYYRIVLNKGNSIITIENELQMIEEYVRINRSLQEKSFTFSVHAEQEVLRCHILKLLLQPIVENALQHGITNRENGQITLDIRPEGDDIIFTVTDNGYGMPEETAENILKDSYVSPNGGGYGLCNTLKRIKSCYGEGYGIAIKSRLGEGTVVEIRIRNLPEEELKKRVNA